jgi:hypothetical protein
MTFHGWGVPKVHQSINLMGFLKKKSRGCLLFLDYCDLF